MKSSEEIFKKINIVIDWRYTSKEIIPAKIIRIPCNEQNNYYYYICHNCELFARNCKISYHRVSDKYYIPLNIISETNPKKILAKALMLFGHFLSNSWLYNSVSFQEQKTFEDIEL